MTEERWQQLVGRIKDEFDVLSCEKSNDEDSSESTEEIIFNGPAGKMRLIRIIKPRLLGEKTFYSGRLAAQTSIQKVYSDTETIDIVKLYRASGRSTSSDSEDWIEIDAGALG